MLRTERKGNSCLRFKFFSFYDIVLVFVVVLSAFFVGNVVGKGGLGRFHGW